MYPIEYYANRGQGIPTDAAHHIAVVVDTTVCLIRCILAVAVLHTDITAVARQAAMVQEWQRKAADARL